MRRVLGLCLTVFLVAFFAWMGGHISRGMLPGYLADAHNPAYTENNKVHRYLRDGQGRERLDIGMFNGQPIQDFFGEDRSLRLQIGTYTNDVRENEKGLPVMTLYDLRGSLRELLRLDGSNQSPLFILKDHGERNRLIMGLGLEDTGEEPFLVWYDAQGHKNVLFGNF